MIRFIRDLRLIPIAVFASACLLALKTADLVFDRGHLMGADDAPPVDAGVSVIRAMPDAPQGNDWQRSWAQRMLNFPDASGHAPAAASAAPAPIPAIAPAAADRINPDITGSVQASPGEGRKGADGKEKDVKPVNGTAIPADGSPPPSGAERAILERLQQRRQELDARARELDIREGLIAAAEKRVEARLAELKEVEANIAAATGKKDETDAARFKGLVTMYENMKPRDAAKIFDRLEIGVLLQVASQINPRRMADILAQMGPETAERLTVELANRAQAMAKGGPGDLPKIEGRPTTP